MFNFEDALKLIGEQIVLCVGDLMLDDFVYGEVSRISPEAPTPVLSVRRHELLVGGAGNVARTLQRSAHAAFLSASSATMRPVESSCGRLPPNR